MSIIKSRDGDREETNQVGDWPPVPPSFLFKFSATHLFHYYVKCSFHQTITAYGQANPNHVERSIPGPRTKQQTQPDIMDGMYTSLFSVNRVELCVVVVLRNVPPSNQNGYPPELHRTNLIWVPARDNKNHTRIIICSMHCMLAGSPKPTMEWMVVVVDRYLVVVRRMCALN